jgi:hypothetical protein
VSTIGAAYDDPTLGGEAVERDWLGLFGGERE